MAVECIFEILELPNATLSKVLPKASARSLTYLLAAYPRTASATFFRVLQTCVSRATIEFLEDEATALGLPSIGQIRRAESELIKLVRTEDVELPLALAA